MMRQWSVSFAVPRTHPALAGHFPGRPIVPGVVLLDLVFAAIQAAAPEHLRIQTVTQAKFLRPVEPDQQIDVSITLDDPPVLARFRALHAGELALEGIFALALEDAARVSAAP